MKRLLLSIVCIVLQQNLFGMEDQSKQSFTPGHRRTASISSFSQQELTQIKNYIEEKKTPKLTRQTSDFSTTLDPMNLLRDAQRKVTEQKKQLDDLEEEKQNLNKEITALKLEIDRRNQPNKFMHFYVTTSLSYMIGTLLYFTYPRWSGYIRDALPHLLHYKK